MCLFFYLALGLYSVVLKCLSIVIMRADEMGLPPSSIANKSRYLVVKTRGH